jgi:hypothetical protein
MIQWAMIISLNSINQVFVMVTHHVFFDVGSEFLNFA